MKTFENQHATQFTPSNVPWGKRPIHECHFIIREQRWTNIIQNLNQSVEVQEFLDELKNHHVRINSVPTYMARAFDLVSAEVKNQAYSDLENSKLLKRPVKDKNINVVLRIFIQRLDLGLKENDDEDG